MTHVAGAHPFPMRAVLWTLLVNALWINASEVFRYFVFVMPMMREALPQVPDVAPMNLPVFAIWGAWDMILIGAVTGFAWLYLARFGPSLCNALIAGTIAWLGIFVLLWLALYNMRLTTPAIPAIALPLAWLELVVAALIVRWGMRRFQVMA